MACEKLGYLPQNAIYVGDAERDIQAGKAAGLHTVLAMYGYLSELDAPENWLADSMIDEPIQLADLLAGKNPKPFS